jgi:hypothetical protein
MYAGSFHAVDQRERYIQQYTLGIEPPLTPYHRLVYAYKDRPTDWYNMYSVVYDQRDESDREGIALLLEQRTQIEDYVISEHEYALDCNDHHDLMQWLNNRKHK